MWAWTVHMCFSVRITHWRMKEINGLHLNSHSFVTLIALLTSDSGLWHFKRLFSLIMWSSPGSPSWLMFLHFIYPGSRYNFFHLFSVLGDGEHGLCSEREELINILCGWKYSWPQRIVTWLRFVNDLFPSQVTVAKRVACYMGAIFCRHEVSQNFNHIYMSSGALHVPRFKEILNTVWDLYVVFMEVTAGKSNLS